MGLAALDVGARVEIHGLKKSPELNGQRGKIIGLLERSASRSSARHRAVASCRPKYCTQKSLAARWPSRLSIMK